MMFVKKLPDLEPKLCSAIRRHIMRKKMRLKQEFEQEAIERRLKRERDLKQSQDAMTLDQIKEQLQILEKKLANLKDEKHSLFVQLKQVLSEDSSRKKKVCTLAKQEQTVSRSAINESKQQTRPETNGRQNDSQPSPIGCSKRDPAPFECTTTQSDTSTCSLSIKSPLQPKFTPGIPTSQRGLPIQAHSKSSRVLLPPDAHSIVRRPLVPSPTRLSTSSESSTRVPFDARATIMVDLSQSDLSQFNPSHNRDSYLLANRLHPFHQDPHILTSIKRPHDTVGRQSMLEARKRSNVSHSRPTQNHTSPHSNPMPGLQLGLIPTSYCNTPINTPYFRSEYPNNLNLRQMSDGLGNNLSTSSAFPQLLGTPNHPLSSVGVNPRQSLRSNVSIEQNYLHPIDHMNFRLPTNTSFYQANSAHSSFSQTRYRNNK